MKNIKKLLMFVFAFVVSFGALCTLTACGNHNHNNNKISVVCTIFPEYDWVSEVIGEQKDNFDLTLLMNNGTDLHSYQPSVKDIAKIAKADLFVYVGGESDEWVDETLKNVTNKNMVVINLMDVLGDKAKEEELKEGMQGEEEHEHEGEHEDEEEEEEHEYDEHVWLSLKNAKIFVSEFANQIAEIDGENKDAYLNNARSYNQKLDALDAEYQQAVDNGSVKTLLFGDRFPFRYLVEDYGLDYYAAFVGCSAETEASFETITFLANKVNELGLKVILKIESSDGEIANTIKQNSNNKNQQVLTLDSMQSTTLKDNATYLSIMQGNLTTLSEAVK